MNIIKKFAAYFCVITLSVLLIACALPYIASETGSGAAIVAEAADVNYAALGTYKYTKCNSGQHSRFADTGPLSGFSTGVLNDGVATTEYNHYDAESYHKYSLVYRASNSTNALNITFDLGQSRTINSVKLYGYQYTNGSIFGSWGVTKKADDLTIHVKTSSSVNGTYTEKASATVASYGTSSGTFTKTISVSATSRYVRLTFDYPAEYLLVSEIQIIGEGAATPALSSPTVSVSNLSNGGANRNGYYTTYNKPTITWNAVPNATSYEVYLNGSLYNTVTATQCTLNISTFSSYGKDSNTRSRERIYVVAKASGYDDSEPSNEISLLYVPKPTNRSGDNVTSADVIIDAGHGGTDSGAVLGTRYEKNDTLNMALKVGDYLEAAGYTVAYVRTTDTYESPATKAAKANAGSYRAFLCFHRNSTAGAVGVEYYAHSSSSVSISLSSLIESEINSDNVWRNRGQKTNDDYAILKTNSVPTVLLELGFISTASDNTLYDTYFNETAQSVSRATIGFLGQSIGFEGYLENPQSLRIDNAAVSTGPVSVTNGNNGTVALSGWHIDSFGISSYKYSIDNGAQNDLTSYDRSGELTSSNAYGVNHSNSGYSGQISVTGLTPGTHTIELYAVTNWESTSRYSSTYKFCTVNLSVDAVSYTVTYLPCGGTGSVDGTTHYYMVSGALSSGAFSRSGYDFAGWRLSRQSDGKYLYVQETDPSNTKWFTPDQQDPGYAPALYQPGTIVSDLSPAADDTVYCTAQWDPHVYTVTFDVNGGSEAVSPLSGCEYGTQYCLPEYTGTMTGYDFGGWSFNGETYGDGGTFLDLTPADGGSVLLTAIWNPGLVDYSVTRYLLSEDGEMLDSSLSSFTAYTGTSVSIVDINRNYYSNGEIINIDGTNYAFKNLYSGSEQVDSATVLADGSLSLAAYYERCYKLTSNSNEEDAVGIMTTGSLTGRDSNGDGYYDGGAVILKLKWAGIDHSNYTSKRLSAKSVITINGKRVFPLSCVPADYGEEGCFIALEYKNGIDYAAGKTANGDAIGFDGGALEIYTDLIWEDNVASSNINFAAMGATTNKNGVIFNEGTSSQFYAEPLSTIRFGTVLFSFDESYKNTWINNNGFGTLVLQLKSILKVTAGNGYAAYIASNGNVDPVSSFLYSNYYDKGEDIDLATLWTIDGQTDTAENWLLGSLKNYIDQVNEAKTEELISFGSGVALTSPARYIYYKDDVQNNAGFIEYSAVLTGIVPGDRDTKVIGIPYIGAVQQQSGGYDNNVYSYCAPVKAYSVNGIINDICSINIPDISGLSAASARATLEMLGLYCEEVAQNSETVEAGKVIGYSPSGNVQPGTTVTIIVSAGYVLNEIPDVSSMTGTQARAALEAAGFVYAEVFEYSGSVEAGHVIGYSPSIPSSSGTTVTVVISLGVRYVEVPDVTGMTKTAARSAIESAGLVYAETEIYDDHVAEGLAISCLPSGTVPENTVVTVSFSKGPMSVVPDVTGLTKAAAQTAIESAGYVYYEIENFDDHVADGLVVSYTPTGAIPVGTTIIVTVSKGIMPTMPDIVGMTESEARLAVEVRNMILAVTFEYSYTMEAGKIICQDIEPGVLTQSGATVNAVVSLGKYQTINPYYVKAVWFSQFDTEVHRTDNLSTYENSINSIMQNISSMGFNTVIVQVRPNGDSFYPSEYYPWSKYVLHSNTYNSTETKSFDPLEIMVEKAHANNLSIQAWVNPLRLMSPSNIAKISSDFAIKQWYDDPYKNGKYIVEVDSLLYLNPAYPDTRELVINGIKEICLNYNVDGIHIDDYFYPTTAASFDSAAYSASGASSLSAFRTGNVNALVQGIYNAVKEIDTDLIFGIAPAGNINNNVNTYYADVYTWGSETGYCDYLMPQIYWGFDHSTAPYVSKTADWRNVVINGNVKLYAGLGAYRAVTHDGEYAGSTDELKRQVEYIVASEPKYTGIAAFSYSYLNTATYPGGASEINNFIDALHNNYNGEQPEEPPEDPPEDPPEGQDINYALASSGGSYTITDNTSGSLSWVGSCSDASFTRLNDGVSVTGETKASSASLGGTNHSYTFRFDLGASRSGVSQVVLKNIINNGNRGYNSASIDIKAGTSSSGMSTVAITNKTEAVLGNGGDVASGNTAYTVTLDFAAVSARYVYITISTPVYVLSLDEIEIW